MRPRYRLYRRKNGGRYYIHDDVTGKQESLGTSDRPTAVRLFHSKNEAVKLEPHREAIFALRRKHWSYGQIAEWLNEHGVTITLSSVHRFCERAIARRPRNGSPLPVAESFSIQTPPTKNNQHRFNLEI